jgi:hypothetical protein
MNNGVSSAFVSAAGIWTAGVGFINQGIVGIYNPSYRRRLYAMGTTFMGSSDGSGALLSLTNYYGLTFAVDNPSYVNITGLSLGHGLELIVAGASRGFFGDGGFYTAGLLYVGGGATIASSLAVSGAITEGSIRVAKYVIADVDPTTSDIYPVGTIWFNKAGA